MNFWYIGDGTMLMALSSGFWLTKSVSQNLSASAEGFPAEGLPVSDHFPLTIYVPGTEKVFVKDADEFVEPLMIRTVTPFSKNVYVYGVMPVPLRELVYRTVCSVEAGFGLTEHERVQAEEVFAKRGVWALVSLSTPPV
jgi:hypothetical protein